MQTFILNSQKTIYEIKQVETNMLSQQDGSMDKRPLLQSMMILFDTLSSTDYIYLFKDYFRNWYQDYMNVNLFFKGHRT